MKNRYRKREEQIISAVQLNLDTTGFHYEKWGETQHCQSGDWVVNNNNECYTIKASTFADTYEEVSSGCYRKIVIVTAEPAQGSGVITTNEGSTQYSAGDYIVHNRDDGTDSYAVEKALFEHMYELVE